MERSARVQIEWECQQLLNRVTMLLDNGSWAELAACYTEDAVLYRPSDPTNGVRGREAILRSFEARPPRISCHLLANTVFDVVSATDVRAFSRVLLMTGAPSETAPAPADKTLLAGSFEDRLVLTNEGWRVASRQGTIELQYTP
ncbi:MAG: nuclear transport factor 2 family protein [Spongiibacteraceae bacterium]|jgi:hypothetical protein|nr:nuclear transport factor 2 family protein [Spongiibacteraceae bacterium]